MTARPPVSEADRACPTGDELTRPLDDLLNAADLELRRQQAEYDAVTEHGTIDPASPT